MTDAADWFSKYKFCQPLGQGGMGTVYLAEDRLHGNRPCVVKQLTNKFSDPHDRSEAVRLFQREAAILRSLDHIGIVRVFDNFVSEDGRYFLVMDYVPGKNLEVMLDAGGPCGNEFAVQIMIQCCEVLEYLHCQDPPILYRDLKPNNLMLTPDGRIVFIDFGIARAFMPKQSATRVVTAGYSPPEQYSGNPETRSDLYALGATMFQLLTGRRPKPLTASTPGLLNSKVNHELDDLIRRMTAHNVEDRPPSARAVRFELYYIYKILVPSFQIPPEAQIGRRPTIQQPEDPLSPRAYVRARFGHLSKTMMELEDPVASEPESSKLEGPSLWVKFKQWLGIMFS